MDSMRMPSELMTTPTCRQAMSFWPHNNGHMPSKLLIDPTCRQQQAWGVSPRITDMPSEFMTNPDCTHKGGRRA